MKAAALLERLDRVREKAPGRWTARCPAHDDRSPSLSIREASDGTVLIKCFAGCGAVDVVTAAGLELKDLFPDRPGEPRDGVRPNHWHAIREAMETLDFEVLVVVIAADDMAKGLSISPAQADRVALAAGRIRAAVKACL